MSILAVPLYDTLRVFFIRVFNGYPPLYADRNHIHHVLLDLGIGHGKSTIIIVMINVMIIAFAHLIISLSIGLSIFLLSIFVFSLISIPFLIIKRKNLSSE